MSNIYKRIVLKSESFRIKSQEHDKMAQRISSRVPVPVKSSALMKYIPSSLDRIIVARALEIFVWEKPKVEFPNWHIVGNGSSCSSTEGI